MRARRGVSLAAILALISLAALLAFLVARALGEQAVAARHIEQRALAQQYAENALEATLARLEQDVKFGVAKTETVDFPALPDQPIATWGKVSFVNGTAGYRSLNNSQNDSAMLGSTGRPVPAHAIHLVADGSYSGMIVREEWVIGTPDFDFALASSGPLATSGAFFLGALEDPAVLSSGTDSAAFQKALKRGSLVSDSAASTAVALDGSPVTITGDVLSPGNVHLGPGVVVDGLVQEGHRPVDLPQIHVEDFDPRGQPLLIQYSDDQLDGGEEIKGYARRQGNLTVNGPLNLTEGVLFVDGDLTVNGPVSGIGAVFVTGRTTVASASLASLKQLAIVSKGDVTVTGHGKETTTLVGLVYTSGNLVLADVTVVGAVVAAGSSDKRLTLTNVNAFKSSKGVAFSFEVGWQVPTSVTVGGNTWGSGGTGAVVRLKPQYAHPSDFFQPNGSTDLVKDSAGSWTLPDAKVDTYFEVVDSSGQPVAGQSASSYLVGDAALQIQSLVRKLATAAGDAHDAQGPAIQRGQVDLNLNRFLRLSDRLKVLYRRVF